MLKDMDHEDHELLDQISESEDDDDEFGSDQDSANQIKRADEKPKGKGVAGGTHSKRPGFVAGTG